MRRGRSVETVKNMGSIYWQFQTVWQSPSWATVDYSGNWKVSHSFVQKIYGETMVTSYKEKDMMHIWTVNDQSGFDGKVILKFFTYDQKNGTPKKVLSYN